MVEEAGKRCWLDSRNWPSHGLTLSEDPKAWLWSECELRVWTEGQEPQDSGPVLLAGSLRSVGWGRPAQTVFVLMWSSRCILLWFQGDWQPYFRLRESYDWTVAGPWGVHFQEDLWRRQWGEGVERGGGVMRWCRVWETSLFFGEVIRCK